MLIVQTVRRVGSAGVNWILRHVEIAPTVKSFLFVISPCQQRHASKKTAASRTPAGRNVNEVDIRSRPSRRLDLMDQRIERNNASAVTATICRRPDTDSRIIHRQMLLNNDRLPDLDDDKAIVHIRPRTRSCAVTSLDLTIRRGAKSVLPPSGPLRAVALLSLPLSADHAQK